MAARRKAKPLADPVVVEDSIPEVVGVLVHPDAARLPMMSPPDLDKMAADIKLNRLQEPVEYMRGKDGRPTHLRRPQPSPRIGADRQSRGSGA
jgi:hypothetical protein